MLHPLAILAAFVLVVYALVLWDDLRDKED